MGWKNGRGGALSGEEQRGQTCWSEVEELWGRGGVAGVDRGGHGFEKHICWRGHWEVFQEYDCFEGERKSCSPVPNYVV